MVIHQHSRKLLKMDILMSETCWANNKWNKYNKWLQVGFWFLSSLLRYLSEGKCFAQKWENVSYPKLKSKNKLKYWNNCCSFRILFVSYFQKWICVFRTDEVTGWRRRCSDWNAGLLSQTPWYCILQVKGIYLFSKVSKRYLEPIQPHTFFPRRGKRPDPEPEHLP